MRWGTASKGASRRQTNSKRGSSLSGHWMGHLLSYSLSGGHDGAMLPINPCMTCMEESHRPLKSAINGDKDGHPPADSWSQGCLVGSPLLGSWGRQTGMFSPYTSLMSP